MKDKLATMAITQLFDLRDRIKQSPFLKNAFYRAANSHGFTSLWWHDVMLHDHGRVNAYAKGIEATVKPGDTIVEIGTGTGILAMLAAKRGAKVYAIDHSAIIETAKKVAAANGITSVEFIQTHSKDFVPPEKVDLILHEQIGNTLIDEDMCQNLLDAKKRMLKPGGKILPGMFELCAVPVMIQKSERIPFVWEQNINGISFAAIRPNEQPRDSGYDKIRFSPGDIESELGPRSSLLKFDLNTVDSVDHERVFTAEESFTQDGELHGMIVYFRFGFDDKTWFSTLTDRMDSWSVRLYRTEPTKVKKGQPYSFAINVHRVTDSDNWRWKLDLG